MRRICVENGVPARRKPLDERPLLPRNRLDGPEVAQVARSDRRDQTDLRDEGVRQCSDVSRSLGTELEQADRCGLGHRQKRQWEADLRVVVLRRVEDGVSPIGLAQQMGEEGTRRRLPVAAGDPDERGVERVAPRRRETLERGKRVVDDDEVAGVSRCRLRITDQRAARPAGEGI